MNHQPQRRQILCAALLPWAWPMQATPQTSTEAAPGLMRASPYHPGIDVAAHWVSEKLDGVRARWREGQLITRSGWLVNAPAAFMHGWPEVELDGELWAGRGRFEQTSATVRRYAGNDTDWHTLRFMVFDLPGHPGAFSDRWLALQSLANAFASPTWGLVAQTRLANAAELQAHLAQVVAEGGEGLMLNHGAGHYRSGPSPHLLKLKPQADAEALVLGHEPGQGAFTGMVGALRVQTPEGLVFRLGSGLSLAERQTPPAIGSWVTYRYRGHHASGVPRFATFWRVRPSE
jgi:DNA ligase-1